MNADPTSAFICVHLRLILFLQAPQPMLDIGDVRERFRENKIRRVKLCAVDIDGVLRGKWVSVDKFLPMSDSTTSFCDVIFGWDIGDVLLDNVKYTGWHTGFPDAVCRPDLETYREIPW